MTRIECPGLDGSNPLHFLASLGILRTLPGGSRMGWRFEKAWHPWFDVDADVTNFALDICRVLRRGVQDHPEVLPARKRDGTADKVKCDPMDRAAIQEAWDFLCFSEIPKVKPGVFRAAAKLAIEADESILAPLHPANILASLNAENIPDKDGQLEPTAFSFSNGGGMQFLLKDFVSLVSLLSAEAVRKLVCGDSTRFVWFTSLNWDPLALRSYATQWGDPESFPKETDVAANVLAFIGLGCLPVAPTSKGNIPPCYDPDRKMFRWPIWEAALGLDPISSILAAGRDFWQVSSGAVGISGQFESERFSSNKRLYFSPSRSL